MLWWSAHTRGTNAHSEYSVKIKRGAQRWTILAPWLFTELKLEDGDRGNLPLISPWMCSRVWVRQRLSCTVCQVLKGEWSKTPSPLYLGQQGGPRQWEQRGQGLKTHLHQTGPKLNYRFNRNYKLADTACGIQVTLAHRDMYNLS